MQPTVTISNGGYFPTRIAVNIPVAHRFNSRKEDTLLTYVLPKKVAFYAFGTTLQTEAQKAEEARKKAARAYAEKKLKEHSPFIQMWCGDEQLRRSEEDSEDLYLHYYEEFLSR